MASYLQIENISKSYGPKILFEKIGFNINEGDKIALIAPNGTGKTSLMRILAGKDKSDSGGKIMFLKEFGGFLIIVSHDRHFLDKLVDHLFIFCGNGLVKDFVGSYSEYREFIKEYEAEQRSIARAEEKAAKEKAAKEAVSSAPEVPAKKKKLSYKEQKELEQLEKDLESLAAEKAALEDKLGSGTLPFEELQSASERIGQIMELTDEKELRWLELSENL